MKVEFGKNELDALWEFVNKHLRHTIWKGDSTLSLYKMNLLLSAYWKIEHAAKVAVREEQNNEQRNQTL